MVKTILVTGGAGYIGSHTSLALLNAGYDVVVLDNLCNSSAESVLRVEQICGRSVEFVCGDIRDRALLDRVFADYDIYSVIHFAGLKAVGESVEQPLSYYANNVSGTVVLCQAMASAGVFNLVFSSSATVYGEAPEMPIREDFPTGAPTNPYGRSKLMVEEVLSDLACSDERWHFALLRYFNPVGAHQSGLIGEDPRGIPNNLMPYISQVAIGKQKKLFVFGDDYDTKDGTGVRDYIHVVDLANGHLRALDKLKALNGLNIWNLGTGKGYTVLQIIKAFEKIIGRQIEFEIKPRRNGDVAECYADPTKACKELNWVAELGIDEMMRDTWNWVKNNPEGFQSR